MHPRDMKAVDFAGCIPCCTCFSPPLKRTHAIYTSLNRFVLCVPLGQSLSKGSGKGALICIWQPCAEVWESGQLASVMRAEYAGLFKASQYVLHHLMAGRGARFFCFRQKWGQSSSLIATNGTPRPD
eukprot:376544-Pelagomonas_calceolata.AAC.3